MHKRYTLLVLFLFFNIFLFPQINEYQKERRIIRTAIKTTVMSVVLIKTELPALNINYKLHTFTTHSNFLFHIGFIESTNDYKKINSLGYLGKYQFGKSTLKTLKYKGSTVKFLNSPELQETMMLKLLKYNQKRLRRYIKKYSGTIINGVVITESGMLAAAHLAGQGNVKSFFRKGINPKDSYGTSLTKYLCEFSGYSLQLN